MSRFLENKDDIAKIRKCFAGLWSLDDSDIVKDAIERPEFYVMKPQREGGGSILFLLCLALIVSYYLWHGCYEMINVLLQGTISMEMM